MATAKTTSNRNYNDVNHYLGISSEIETGSKEWYQAIKKLVINSLTDGLTLIQIGCISQLTTQERVKVLLNCMLNKKNQI